MHAKSRKGLNSTFSILHTAPNLNKFPRIHTHTLSHMIIQCFSSCGVRAVVSLGVVHGWETVQIVIGGQTVVDWCLPLCKTEGAEMCRCGFFFSLAVIRVIHTDFSTYTKQPSCVSFFCFLLSVLISLFSVLRKPVLVCGFSGPQKALPNSGNNFNSSFIYIYIYITYPFCSLDHMFCCGDVVT